ncbi:MAG: M20 family metallopeptidase [Anaerolineales bacterium]|jgi:amidohydrolase
MPTNQQQVLREAYELFETTRGLRRDFHQHPELGFQEVRTAGIVARELRELGLEVSTGIGQTGVVGILEGAQPGPTVLVRFDMDALPIQEETGTEYASQNEGVMHACGHDGHTAIGLTVARLLHAHRQELAGNVKLVFQPAEEGLGGARHMIADGVLEQPKPDLALALHLWNEEPVGTLCITPGPVMAASETFLVQLTGSGGHGAAPHQTIDPVLAASQVVTALQSIVSRNVDPLHSAVVSATAIKAGEAFNVIPETAEIRGTIRTYLPETRQLVLRRFEEIIQGVASAFGCQAEISVREITTAVINAPEITSRVQQAARQTMPQARLLTDYRSMGSEDMAYMMDTIPGCYFFVGSRNDELGFNAPHHNPHFDIDEQALPQAAGLMTAAAIEFLQPEA